LGWSWLAGSRSAPAPANRIDPTKDIEAHDVQISPDRDSRLLPAEVTPSWWSWIPGRCRLRRRTSSV
jgi:hypothetical protein